MFVGEYGILNHALAAIGIAGRNGFAQPMTARGCPSSPPVGISALLYMVLLAALTAISDDYTRPQNRRRENFQNFWRITSIGEAAILLGLLVMGKIADSFKLYAPSSADRRRPANATNVITTYLYSRTFGDLRFGEGTAGSFLLTIFIALISLTTFRMMRPGSKERAAQ
jgi:ABC-type sugar transport system permease subunit